MNTEFINIQPLRYWVQRVLPLVYDDSLSYMELLNKVVYKLNELIENNKLLPDYIADLIKEYISSGAIEKVLAEILADYMLNVKFPPEGLTPATGDGSADDTEAIQGCINYARVHGGMAVYFPSGSYLTQSLTILDKTTMFGYDRYNTRLVLKGGATQPLLTGACTELTLTGLGFDGNMDIQVNNINLIDISVISGIITNCLLTDGYELLKINVSKDLQIDNTIFDHAVVRALNIIGDGIIESSTLLFNSLSTLLGSEYILLNSSNGILNDMYFVGASPTGIQINGNNNIVKFFKGLVTNPFIDNGINNSIEVFTESKIDKVKGNVTVGIGGSYSETVSLSKVENIIGDKELRTDNYTVNINGSLTSSITTDFDNTIYGNTSSTNLGNVECDIEGNAELNIKGDYSENTQNKTLTNNNLIINSTNATENINQTKTIKASQFNENVNNRIIRAENSNEIYQNAVNITAPEYTLNIANHLTYEQPAKLNDYFNSIKFKDPLGNIYNVLVDNDFKFKTKRNIVFIGDSYTMGVGGTSNILPFTISNLLNANSFYVKADGSTGFLTKNTDNKDFISLTNEAVSDSSINKSSISDVVIIGGYNDSHIPHGWLDFYNAIVNIKNLINSAFPYASITIIPCPWINIAPSSNLINTHYNLTYACVQAGVRFSSYSLGWLLYGDDFQSGDNIHPNNNGYLRMAGFISSTILGNDPYQYRYEIAQPHPQIQVYTLMARNMYSLNFQINSPFQAGYSFSLPSWCQAPFTIRQYFAVSNNSGFYLTNYSSNVFTAENTSTSENMISGFITFPCFK